MSATVLYVCASSEENTLPYRFKLTKVRVFSIEEAFYHIYSNWKEVLDDVRSEAFHTWVSNTLGLPGVALRLKDLTRNADDAHQGISEALCAFLGCTGYFEKAELDKLSTDITGWEQRNEWEKQKERGDNLMSHAEYAKAAACYKEAVKNMGSMTAEGGQQYKLLNNAGVACMYLGRLEEAEGFFYRAIEQYTAYHSGVPRSTSSRLQIEVNLCEALILGNKPDASKSLERLERDYDDRAHLLYLRGMLYFNDGQMKSGVEYMEEAVSEDPSPAYIHALCDAYARMRLYDKAVNVLERLSEKDRDYYIKLSGIHADNQNVPAAVKCIEKALITYPSDVILWTLLARYHRLDYDLQRANAAIVKAGTILNGSADADYEFVMMEKARLKKAMGRTKEYQETLHDVIKGFIREYRTG